MLVANVQFTPGVSAGLYVDHEGRCSVEVTDSELGDTTITGFHSEQEARTFLVFGDFDDTPDNHARVLAGLAGLRWA